MLTSAVSKAAIEAGVPERYRYWLGHSGQRYLFTLADESGLGDFGEGVAIAVRGTAVVWSGDIATLGSMPMTAWMGGASLYVHLLAPDADSRRAVIRDLRPTECHLRLAA